MTTILAVAGIFAAIVAGTLGLTLVITKLTTGEWFDYDDTYDAK